MMFIKKNKIIAVVLLSTTSVFSMDSNQCPINNPADFWRTFAQQNSSGASLLDVGNTTFLGHRVFTIQSSSIGEVEVAPIIRTVN